MIYNIGLAIDCKSVVQGFNASGKHLLVTVDKLNIQIEDEANGRKLAKLILERCDELAAENHKQEEGSPNHDHPRHHAEDATETLAP